MARDTGDGGRCPVQVKAAKSRLRLRAILRSPDLPCVSLRGIQCLSADNVVRDGAGGGGGFPSWPGCAVLVRGRLRDRGWRWPSGGAGRGAGVVVEAFRPVRRFAARKGHRHLSGLWWSSTAGGHVRFESWLERPSDAAGLRSGRWGYCLAGVLAAVAGRGRQADFACAGFLCAPCRWNRCAQILIPAGPTGEAVRPGRFRRQRTPRRRLPSLRTR
jgi:hypothetical protein